MRSRQDAIFEYRKDSCARPAAMALAGSLAPRLLYACISGGLFKHRTIKKTGDFESEPVRINKHSKQVNKYSKTSGINLLTQSAEHVVVGCQ